MMALLRETTIEQQGLLGKQSSRAQGQGLKTKGYKLGGYGSLVGEVLSLESTELGLNPDSPFTSFVAWTSYLTSQSLSFFICKMRTKIPRVA